MGLTRKRQGHHLMRLGRWANVTSKLGLHKIGLNCLDYTQIDTFFFTYNCTKIGSNVCNKM